MPIRPQLTRRGRGENKEENKRISLVLFLEKSRMGFQFIELVFARKESHINLGVYFAGRIGYRLPVRYRMYRPQTKLDHTYTQKSWSLIWISLIKLYKYYRCWYSRYSSKFNTGSNHRYSTLWIINASSSRCTQNVERQNVERQNVELQNVDKYKTSTLQNVESQIVNSAKMHHKL
jgi:hypothetical protein